MGLSYAKLCNVEDFARPEISDLVREIVPWGVDKFGPSFPVGAEDRKHWEIAQSLRALRDFGVLHESAEVLGVGAGAEATIFWLSNHVKRVFATDIYADLSSGWGRQAPPEMLVDPMLVAPVAANGRRIVAQHMDARDLRYEDATFDGVFSASSLEHFGTDEDIMASVAEMHRVLKPGGVLAISTEFKIAGPGVGNPGLRYFPAEDLRRLVIESRPWVELDELDLTLSEATLGAPTSFEEAMAVLQQGSDRWPSYPHVVISDGRGYRWTSVSLALRKPA